MFSLIEICTSGLKLSISTANATKNKSSISGDSFVNTKLHDGKYMMAISDGMGSGPRAKKSSSTVIKMLKRLLTTGFDKDVSIGLLFIFGLPIIFLISLPLELTFYILLKIRKTKIKEVKVTEEEIFEDAISLDNYSTNEISVNDYLNELKYNSNIF